MSTNGITHPYTSRPHPTQIPPSLLLLILDIHPLSWSLLASPPPSEDISKSPHPVISRAPYSSIDLKELIQIILVFLKAHLASRWGNGVVVYAATAGRAKLIYPPTDENLAGPSKPSPNVYQPFRHLDRNFEVGLKEMINNEEARLIDGGGKGLNEPPAIVAALTKALCYINRQTPPPPPASALTSQPNLSDPNNPTGSLDPNSTAQERVETRIMVINATPGGGGAVVNGNRNGLGESNGDTNGKGKTNGSQGRGGYVGLMNCVFAAQKSKVPIDILTLPPPFTNTSHPIFLQQAAHLTGGIYWRWNGRGALLQYLHAIYLAPPALRQTPFTSPPQEAVDFRAVCFCHQDVVDVGFVCSVCLSIFCKPLPVCLMCKTKFPIKSLPALKALADGIQPIPIPDINVPPPLPKNRGHQKSASRGENHPGGGGRREEAIVID